MMEEEDEDALFVVDVEDVSIRASVFEAYSRQKSADSKARKTTTSTLGHLERSGTPPTPLSAKKPKENLSLKLKKYFASKLSETTTGQGIIQNYISERGQAVIRALCHCMVKFSGRDIARVMRRYTYKLASKFGILYAERIISEEKLNRAREPILVLAYHLLNILNCSEEDRKDTSRVQGLKALITDAYVALQPLCCNLTRQSNTERLRVVYEYLTKGEFLNFFLCSALAEQERLVISDALETEMESAAGDPEKINRTFRQKLYRRRSNLSSLVGAPSLRNYLRNAETYKLVTTWMAGNGGEGVLNCLKFSVAVQEYESLTTRSLIARRGQSIFEEFLEGVETSGLPIPAVVVEEIHSKVHAEVFPLNLFWDAYSATLQSMEGLFMEFLSSQEFQVLQLELHRVEKQLQVLAELSGISDESFMVLLAKENNSPVKNDFVPGEEKLFETSFNSLKEGSNTTTSLSVSTGSSTTVLPAATPCSMSSASSADFVDDFTNIASGSTLSVDDDDDFSGCGDEEWEDGIVG